MIIYDWICYMIIDINDAVRYSFLISRMKYKSQTVF